MPTKRILCVDDNEDITYMLKSMLCIADLEAVTVPDVAEAIRLMEREQFSLYILDGELPGVSGLTLCEQIRATDKHTPIVIFSGHDGSSDIDAGMLQGANAYLVKPDISEIIPTVKRLLDAARNAAP